MSIRTLGALTVALGGATQPLRFATHLVEALLVYLACQDRTLGRDELAELLWPERTQEQARVNLRVTLYRLRSQVDPYLLVTRQQLALNPDAVVDLDARQFERHLAAGELAAAVALYRGDFLAGFYLDDSPAFEQWALLERERLRTLAIAAYQQLVDQAATAGQFDAATAWAQHLLQLDPLHEPSHRQLMRLLAQTGQRSAALAQYETCRTLLASELDVTPDAVTIALHERIRTQAQEIAVDDGVAISIKLTASPPVADNQYFPTPHTKAHNLPLQATPLIGRSAELAQIGSLLANPDCRLLTLLGAGGIGKTRLAIEAAKRVVEAATVGASHPASAPNVQHQDLWVAEEVYFVSLASVEKAELVLATIAQSLELQATGSDLRAGIVVHLQERNLLLVLDNFEHLQEASEVVVHLLQQAPSIKLLITSRERLHLREEWLMPVAGLPQAEGLLSEAGQLFFRSAQRVQPSFSSYGQEEAIAAICVQVEGMPLAIELAASWVRFMPCAEIARQLAQNSYMFTTTLRNVPERHRSLRSLFDQSWRLLSPSEQSVLRRVSVFRGGWTLEEGAQVADATLPGLIGLVDKSLVRTNGQGRFDLHELVRQYAAEQLGTCGEVDLIRQRHHATYLQLFRTADSPLRGPDVAAWLARLEPEQDNLRAVLQWALDERCYADMAWLLLAVAWFWFLTGQWQESVNWMAQLLPHREALDADVRLAILLDFGRVDRASKEFRPFDRYTNEVLGLLEICPDKALHAEAWNRIAVCAADLAEASAARERAIAYARAAREEPRLGPEFGVVTDRDHLLSSPLFSYAATLIEHGEFERAAPLLAELFRLAQEQGNRYRIADSLVTAGRLALLQGNTDRAHTLLHEGVTLGKALNYQRLLGESLSVLGLVTLYCGDAGAARQLLADSLRLCLELNDGWFLGRVCTYLAETALWEGELDEAKSWLAQSLGYHTNGLLSRIDQVERLLVAARLATAQGASLRAATLFGAAQALRSQLHYELAGPARLLADAALATVRTALDPAVFAAAFDTGRQLTLAEAFATVLAPTHSIPI